MQRNKVRAIACFSVCVVAWAVLRFGFHVRTASSCYLGSGISAATVYFAAGDRPYRRSILYSIVFTLLLATFTVTLFDSIADARRKIEAWRTDDNELRPHGSLGDLTPDELISKGQVTEILEVADSR